MKLLRLLVCLLVTLPCCLTKADQLDCLNESERQTSSLYGRLQQRAYEALDARTERLSEIQSSNQIESYQQNLKAFFIRQLGGFPERTPLNGKTVKTIQADGYRIENVIFESQPGHHITANLYLPDGASARESARVPGIAVSSGHSRTAKTADYNQRFGIMMARQGMAALCFDPIGQGERSQILDSNGQPKFSGTTTEHFLIGVGSTLVGRSTARYRVWDAMRAIDYLCSRPEIDPTRIGFTGCSGGGTLTSYVMALDERVACAAPACYLTTFQRLIETIGPQDAEQNVFGQIQFGMDQPDYVLMRAPRPTLISSTTQDFFDSLGSWENYRQCKQIYGRLGFPERVDLVEVAGKHGVQPQNLATIAHWMQRWLLEKDEPVEAIELATRPPEDLICTHSSQVLTSIDGEKSVFDLNVEYGKQLALERAATWGKATQDQRRAKVMEVLKLRPAEQMDAPTWNDRGSVDHNGYRVNKLVLTTDSKRRLPALAVHTQSNSDEAYLYLHDNGKRGAIDDPGVVEPLIQSGDAVLCVDLSGQGETANGNRDKMLTDWKTYYLAYLLGDSMVGLRVEDTLAAAKFLSRHQRNSAQTRRIHLVASGQSAIIALHAAAVQPEIFASITLHQMPTSWSSVVGSDTPSGQLDSTIHGVLQHYDLEDLMGLVGRDRIRVKDRKALSPGSDSGTN